MSADDLDDQTAFGLVRLLLDIALATLNATVLIAKVPQLTFENGK